MKRISMIVFLFISGMLTAVPFVFPWAFFVGIVSFAPLAYILYSKIKDISTGFSYLLGLSFFMGFGIVLFSWFCTMYPLEFTGLGKGAAVAVVCAGWIGLSLLQALFWALMFALLKLTDKLCGISRRPIVFSLVLTCLYVIFEWMSTKTWAAVPWGRLAVGQTGFLPMIQISSVLGGYAVSFILVFFGTALGVSLVHYRRNKMSESFRTLAPAVILLAVNLLFGLCRMGYYEIPDDSTAVTVAALQGNISSHEKWTEDSYSKTKKEYSALAREAASDGAKIIVYPETPLTYNLEGRYGDDIKAYYEAVAKITDSTLITGVFTKNEDGMSENSVIAVTPEKGIMPEKYVKRHLVPFGEYVPLRDLVSLIFPPLSDIAMLETDLAEGDEATILETEYGKIAPLICFDSIYENLTLDSVRAGGELLTLSTNDSWFLDSAGVWEHNRHAVLRSVECGRYTARSANTGVSSIISPLGEICDMLPPLETGYVTADVYMISHKTPYTIIGNAIIPVCAFCLIVCLAYCVRKKGEEL